MPALAPAQTAAPDEIPNGRCWSYLSLRDKAVWVWGFEIGVATGITATDKDGKRLMPESSWPEVNRLYSSHLSLAEIVKGIDRFYEDTPENAPVPVSGALEYVTRKANGASQRELDDFASALRKANAE
jgi:hypothetical protein